MKRKVISVVLAMFMLMGAAMSTTFATQKSEIEAKKKTANENLNKVKSEISSELQEIEDLTDTIKQKEQEIQQLTGEIDELTESIKEKEDDLDQKQQLLDERLAAAYMNDGSNTYLEAIFSGGIVNFVSNYDIIKQIAEYDTNLIDEVKAVKESLENEKIKLENSKVESETKRNELNNLKADKESRVSQLSAEQKSIQSQIDEYDREMEKIAAAERAAASRSSSSSGSVTSYSGTPGQLLWPVPSTRYISSPYGYRTHPIYGTTRFHSGIDIATSSGNDIVAAESGTVILASYGYNGGYGNYIIIDHGNGLTTRYAHCSTLYVSVGQSVSRGQRIAAIGSTGASTGPHCHFEVRINGNTQNPVNYV